jgi:Bacterial protein of unknown function (HtrL_YibB)
MVGKFQNFIICITMFLALSIFCNKSIHSLSWVTRYENEISGNIKQFGSLIRKPILRHQVTIVTAYYNISSKRAPEDYLQWIQYFTRLSDNMIIFTSPELVTLLYDFRKSRNNTHIVSLSKSNLSVLHEFGGMDFWSHQHRLDHERMIHSPDLYIVWNSKSNFLKQAIMLNPFHSNFFAWVDIGYLRNSALNGKRMIRYLPPTLLKHQVMLLDVRELVGGIKYVGGGFIGGFKHGLLNWITAYYDVLHSNNQTFIGKDQPWMFSTCLQFPGLCLLIQPNSKYGDPWFYMAPYLSGKVKDLSRDSRRFEDIS